MFVGVVVCCWAGLMVYCAVLIVCCVMLFCGWRKMSVVGVIQKGLLLERGSPVCSCDGRVLRSVAARTDKNGTSFWVPFLSP